MGVGPGYKYSGLRNMGLALDIRMFTIKALDILYMYMDVYVYAADISVYTLDIYVYTADISVYACISTVIWPWI